MMKGEADVLAVLFAVCQEADAWPVCSLSPEGLWFLYLGPQSPDQLFSSSERNFLASPLDSDSAWCPWLTSSITPRVLLLPGQLWRLLPSSSSSPAEPAVQQDEAVVLGNQPEAGWAGPKHPDTRPLPL